MREDFLGERVGRVEAVREIVGRGMEISIISCWLEVWCYRRRVSWRVTEVERVIWRFWSGVDESGS